MKFHEVVPDLTKRFPELITEKLIDTSDHPMMIVGSFTYSLLMKVIEEKNESKIEEAARFVNEVCVNSKDLEFLELIDEIAIGLVSESQSDYDYFKKYLNPHAQECMDASANAWNKGNGIT